MWYFFELKKSITCHHHIRKNMRRFYSSMHYSGIKPINIPIDTIF